jgi:hypothetical protein
MSKTDKIGLIVLIAALLIEAIWLMWPRSSGTASSGGAQLQPTAVAPSAALPPEPTRPAAERQPQSPRQIANARPAAALAQTTIVVE